MKSLDKAISLAVQLTARRKIAHVVTKCDETYVVEIQRGSMNSSVARTEFLFDKIKVFTNGDEHIRTIWIDKSKEEQTEQPIKRKSKKAPIEKEAIREMASDEASDVGEQNSESISSEI